MKTQQSACRDWSMRRNLFLSALLIGGFTADQLAAQHAVPRPTRLPPVSKTAAAPVMPAPHLTPAAPTPAKPTPPASELAPQYLKTATSKASLEIARRLISQGAAEYDSHAWLSAETTTWEALRSAASAIDQGSRDTSACSHLEVAKQAIMEARDFTAINGQLDDATLRRIARSHRTGLITDATQKPLTANDAADRYLDHARVHLAAIAEQNVESAQAMDLLAAIYLARAEAKTLPSGTALCLRRAAIQGQPSNASLASRLGMHLADVGLNDEARWALQHSMSLQFDPATADALVAVLRRSGDNRAADELVAGTRQRPGAGVAQPRKPEIVELSPTEFASLSQSVMTAQAPAAGQVPASLVSSKTAASAVTQGTAQVLAPESKTVDELSEDTKPGAVKRFFNRFKRSW